MPLNSYPWHTELQTEDESLRVEVAMVQNQWYHFGIGAPPILVYFGGGGIESDVHSGTGFWLMAKS